MAIRGKVSALNGHEYYLGDPKGKAIAFQAGLEKDQYEIVTINDPDDLNGSYQKLFSLVETIKAKYGDCHVIANYTGGTKTMSCKTETRLIGD